MAELLNLLSASAPGSEPKRRRSKKAQASALSDFPVNAIDFGRRPLGASPGGKPGLHRADAEAIVSDAESRTPRKSSRTKTPAPTAQPDVIPDTVKERFIQIGSNFFFPDGAEAFTDHGNRITTRSEN